MWLKRSFACPSVSTGREHHEGLVAKQVDEPGTVSFPGWAYQEPCRRQSTTMHA
jgi:hypothetical protein